VNETTFKLRLAIFQSSRWRIFYYVHWRISSVLGADLRPPQFVTISKITIVKLLHFSHFHHVSLVSGLTICFLLQGAVLCTHTGATHTLDPVRPIPVTGGELCGSSCILFPLHSLTGPVDPLYASRHRGQWLFAPWGCTHTSGTGISCLQCLATLVTPT
jgi:hypothetical protein